MSDYRRIHPLGFAGKEVVVLSKWNGRKAGTLTTNGIDWFVDGYLWADCEEEPMYIRC